MYTRRINTFEGLIPLKYYEKSFKRLTQASGENLIINYKIPNVHICNNGVYFETVFILIKNHHSKIILGTHFMALFYPFLVTDEGIKTNVTNVPFNFILPFIPKEINVTILEDTNKERIYRIERSLSSLMTKIFKTIFIL